MAALQEIETLLNRATPAAGAEVVNGKIVPVATIGKTRSGIAVAIKELIGQGGLWVLLGTALVAGIIGIVLHLKIGIYLKYMNPNIK